MITVSDFNLIQLQRNYITTRPNLGITFHWITLLHTGGLALQAASYIQNHDILTSKFSIPYLSLSYSLNLTSVQSIVSIYTVSHQCNILSSPVPHVTPRDKHCTVDNTVRTILSMVVRYFRQHETILYKLVAIYTDDIIFVGSPYSINSNTNFGHCTIMIHDGADLAEVTWSIGHETYLHCKNARELMRQYYHKWKYMQVAIQNTRTEMNVQDNCIRCRMQKRIAKR